MSAYERNHQVSQPTLRREGEAKSKRSLPRKENAWESPPTFILGKTLEKPKRGLRIFKMRVRELCVGQAFFLLREALPLELGGNFRLGSKSLGGCVGMSFEHFGAFSSTLGRW